MKKVIKLLPLGILTMPVITTLSCGSDNKGTENQDLKVLEDGLYILKSDYSGTLLNNSTLAEKQIVNNKVRIGETPGYGLTNSVQMGDGDSVYMLYDQDDNDGLSPDKFNDHFFLEDTSIMNTKIIQAANQKFNNRYIKDSSGSWGHTYVGFTQSKDHNEGIINKYVGGQNNHIIANFDTKSDMFKNSIKLFAKVYKDNYPEVLASVLKYYGLKNTPNKGGEYENDPNISYASNGFVPVFSLKPVFTYEKITNRAIKITFHREENYALTAGHFIIKNNNKYIPYGSLSIGNSKEWSSYYKHSNAKYVATKKFNEKE